MNLKNCYFSKKMFIALSVLFVMIIVNSCADSVDVINKEPEPKFLLNSEYPYYWYEPFWLRIQDASGNDLIKMVGSDWWLSADSDPRYAVSSNGSINPDIYAIEYIYPVPQMDPLYYLQEEVELVNGAPRIIFEPHVPFFGVFIVEDIYHFEFRAESCKQYYEIKLPPADKIIFRLTCPSVFGDNEAHEIITYWEQLVVEDFPDIVNNYKCKKIVFAGKDIEFQRKKIIETDESGLWCHSVATIILDEK